MKPGIAVLIGGPADGKAYAIPYAEAPSSLRIPTTLPSAFSANARLEPYEVSNYQRLIAALPGAYPTKTNVTIYMFTGTS